jgi:hypothetical protein
LNVRQESGVWDSNSTLCICIEMDDLYQLTADAVNQNKGSEDAEKQRQQQEQDDIVLKTFNSFGFSKRWDNLLDTVKKQVIHEGLNLG